MTTPARPTNSILAAIPQHEYENLAPLLEIQPLRMRETLQEAGDPPHYVYFPTSGFISVLTVMENGMMIEFATVGREGTTGVPVFLGMGDTNMALISQEPGEALRMKREDFRAQLSLNPEFDAAMRHYNGLPGDSPFPLESSSLSVAQIETSAFTIVCAWCGDVQTKGNETISHGICPGCTAELLPEGDRLR